MVLGDGIRRNIAYVEPVERDLLIDAFKRMNDGLHKFAGDREDPVPGGVTWWFKQDEIHHATHVHEGPEFLPWHREIVNRLEEMLRKIHPELSLHYWDWTQDPREISNANLGVEGTGPLNLFTSDFMGYGGTEEKLIDKPWESAGFYDLTPEPSENYRGTLREDKEHSNPADPPKEVKRSVAGLDGEVFSPITPDVDAEILRINDYAPMRKELEKAHNRMHNFVSMGGTHISFRDPFVFLLHSNVDRLFTRWQTDPAHPERLKPDTFYGTESDASMEVGAVTQNLNHDVEPWSTGHSIDYYGDKHLTRPWCAPENQGRPHTYKDHSVVSPPRYDTNMYSVNNILNAKNISRPIRIRHLSDIFVGENELTPPISVIEVLHRVISSKID